MNAGTNVVWMYVYGLTIKLVIRFLSRKVQASIKRE